MPADRLAELIRVAADRAEADGVPVDGEPGGAVHRWAVANCDMRPGTDFFVVFLLTAELADRAARKEGFVDQFDRALRLSKRKGGQDETSKRPTAAVH